MLNFLQEWFPLQRPKIRPPARCAGQRGFTLLEVLLAVMILGLSLTAILFQFQVALRAGSKARDVSQAVLHAKEKLEELKSRKIFAESVESGSFDDGYTWETSITPYVYEVSKDDSAYESLRYETFELTAIVKRQIEEREQQLEFSTLKTVRKKEWE